MTPKTPNPGTKWGTKSKQSTFGARPNKFGLFRYAALCYNRAMSKVETVNLERGMPTVAQAMTRMISALTTGKRRGAKAVILIHGYGSTGVGGGIRSAVKARLRQRDLQGIVRMSAGGEQWQGRKKELLQACGSLSAHEREVDGNEGVTVVVLR